MHKQNIAIKKYSLFITWLKYKTIVIYNVVINTDLYGWQWFKSL